MGQTFRRQPIEVTLPPHGVFVLESHHAPGFRMTSQRHAFLEIFYVLDGAGAFHIDGKTYPCRKDDVVVVPVAQAHHLEDDPARPLELFGICVAPQVWQHEPSLVDDLPPGPLPVSTLVAAQVREELRRLLYEQTLARPGSRAWIVGQALQLLVVLARSQSGMSPPSRREDSFSAHRQAVRRYLAELPHRFFESANLDQIAAELGMSRRRFTQLFRELTGVSWSSYRTRLRIDYACRLLRETPRSIIAVAFESGFEDLSSFYRAFKRQTGLPPHAWRQGQSGS
ncbi:MAG TPA: AraC family transcriptional regulator [Gemmataceae bacterium]|nr:AraC family transcriptional regulator [Gemmataceae bacterium]